MSRVVGLVSVTRHAISADTASPLARVSEMASTESHFVSHRIGKQLTVVRDMFGGPVPGERPRAVVGVVGDVREWSVQRESWPAIYVPAGQRAPIRRRRQGPDHHDRGLAAARRRGAAGLLRPHPPRDDGRPDDVVAARIGNAQRPAGDSRRPPLPSPPPPHELSRDRQRLAGRAVECCHAQTDR